MGCPDEMNTSPSVTYLLEGEVPHGVPKGAFEHNTTWSRLRIEVGQVEPEKETNYFHQL